MRKIRSERCEKEVEGRDGYSGIPGFTMVVNLL